TGRPLSSTRARGSQSSAPPIHCRSCRRGGAAARRPEEAAHEALPGPADRPVVQVSASAENGGAGSLLMSAQPHVPRRTLALETPPPEPADPPVVQVSASAESSDAGRWLMSAQSQVSREAQALGTPPEPADPPVVQVSASAENSDAGFSLVSAQSQAHSGAQIPPEAADPPALYVAASAENSNAGSSLVSAQSQAHSNAQALEVPPEAADPPVLYIAASAENSDAGFSLVSAQSQVHSGAQIPPEAADPPVLYVAASAESSNAGFSLVSAQSQAHSDAQALEVPPEAADPPVLYVAASAESSNAGFSLVSAQSQVHSGAQIPPEAADPPVLYVAASAESSNAGFSLVSAQSQAHSGAQIPPEAADPPVLYVAASAESSNAGFSLVSAQSQAHSDAQALEVPPEAADPPVLYIAASAENSDAGFSLVSAQSQVHSGAQIPPEAADPPVLYVAASAESSNAGFSLVSAQSQAHSGAQIPPEAADPPVLYVAASAESSNAGFSLVSAQSQVHSGAQIPPEAADPPVLYVAASAESSNAGFSLVSAQSQAHSGAQIPPEAADPPVLYVAASAESSNAGFSLVSAQSQAHSDAQALEVPPEAADPPVLYIAASAENSDAGFSLVSAQSQVHSGAQIPPEAADPPVLYVAASAESSNAGFSLVSAQSQAHSGAQIPPEAADPPVLYVAASAESSNAGFSLVSAQSQAHSDAQALEVPPEAADPPVLYIAASAENSDAGFSLVSAQSQVHSGAQIPPEAADPPVLYVAASAESSNAGFSLVSAQSQAHSGAQIPPEAADPPVLYVAASAESSNAGFSLVSAQSQVHSGAQIPPEAADPPVLYVAASAESSNAGFSLVSAQSQAHSGAQIPPEAADPPVLYVAASAESSNAGFSLVSAQSQAHSDAQALEVPPEAADPPVLYIAASAENSDAGFSLVSAQSQVHSGAQIPPEAADPPVLYVAASAESSNAGFSLVSAQSQAHSGAQIPPEAADPPVLYVAASAESSNAGFSLVSAQSQAHSGAQIPPEAADPPVPHHHAEAASAENSDAGFLRPPARPQLLRRPAQALETPPSASDPPAPTSAAGNGGVDPLLMLAWLVPCLLVCFLLLGCLYYRSRALAPSPPPPAPADAEVPAPPGDAQPAVGHPASEPEGPLEAPLLKGCERPPASPLTPPVRPRKRASFHELPGPIQPVRGAAPAAGTPKNDGSPLVGKPPLRRQHSGASVGGHDGGSLAPCNPNSAGNGNGNAPGSNSHFPRSSSFSDIPPRSPLSPPTTRRGTEQRAQSMFARKQAGEQQWKVNSPTVAKSPEITFATSSPCSSDVSPRTKDPKGAAYPPLSTGQSSTFGSASAHNPPAPPPAHAAHTNAPSEASTPERGSSAAKQTQFELGLLQGIALAQQYAAQPGLPHADLPHAYAAQPAAARGADARASKPRGKPRQTAEPVSAFYFADRVAGYHPCGGAGVILDSESGGVVSVVAEAPGQAGAHAPGGAVLREPLPAPSAELVEELGLQPAAAPARRISELERKAGRSGDLRDRLALVKAKQEENERLDKILELARVGYDAGTHPAAAAPCFKNRSAELVEELGLAAPARRISELERKAGRSSDLRDRLALVKVKQEENERLDKILELARVGYDGEGSTGSWSSPASVPLRGRGSLQDTFVPSPAHADLPHVYAAIRGRREDTRPAAAAAPCFKNRSVELVEELGLQPAAAPARRISELERKVGRSSDLRDRLALVKAKQEEKERLDKILELARVGYNGYNLQYRHRESGGQKPMPRRPSADRTRRMNRRVTGGFESMISTFSLNSADRRGRVRSAGTPVPTRHGQTTASWVKRWGGWGGAPTPPPASPSPAVGDGAYADAGRGSPLHAAAAGDSGDLAAVRRVRSWAPGGGPAAKKSPSALERSAVQSKRDLLDARRESAGRCESTARRQAGDGVVFSSLDDDRDAPRPWNAPAPKAGPSARDEYTVATEKDDSESAGDAHGTWQTPARGGAHEELLNLFRRSSTKTATAPPNPTDEDAWTAHQQQQQQQQQQGKRQSQTPLPKDEDEFDVFGEDDLWEDTAVHYATSTRPKPGKADKPSSRHEFPQTFPTSAVGNRDSDHATWPSEHALREAGSNLPGSPAGKPDRGNHPVKTDDGGVRHGGKAKKKDKKAGHAGKSAAKGKTAKESSPSVLWQPQHAGRETPPEGSCLQNVNVVLPGDDETPSPGSDVSFADFHRAFLAPEYPAPGGARPGSAVSAAELDAAHLHKRRAASARAASSASRHPKAPSFPGLAASPFRTPPPEEDADDASSPPRSDAAAPADLAATATTLASSAPHAQSGYLALQQAEPVPKSISAAQVLKGEGNAAYQAGRFSDAIVAYNKAIKLDPRNATLHCNRAAAFLVLHYFDRCLSDCQAAISVDPLYAKAHFRAGKALLLQYQPRVARRYYQTALQLVRQQNVDRLDAELSGMEDRIDMDLKAVTFVEQCKAAADQGKWNDALHFAELGEEAVKDEPIRQLRLWALTYVDPVMARVELGHMVSLTQRQVDRGGSTPTSPSSTHPGATVGFSPATLADQLTLLGRASFFSGHLYVSAASQRLKEALHLSPSHKDAQQLLRLVNTFEVNNREASAHYKAGNWAEAFQGYTNCLNLDPANHRLKSVTFNNRAAALLMMGSAVEAVKDCTSAVNEDCTNVKAYARRARAQQDLGSLDAAIRDMELAAQLNPSYVQELRELQKKRDSNRAAAAAAHGHRPPSANSRPSSAGARRSTYASYSTFGGGHAGGGGGAGFASSGGGSAGGVPCNTNFINNFPAAAGHTDAHNYYRVMGLEQGVAAAAVLRKYKQLALRYHPDRCSSPEARVAHEKIFKEIGEARAVLADAKLRADYDLQLACNALR
ncbi:DnaJ-like protein subfamily C member 7-like protein, partial [Diplonema papillatum]